MSFGARELDALVALLRRTAQQEIMPRFRKLGPGAVRTKSGPLDLVTEADEAAERAIASGIERLFPGALVVGEEAAAADPALPSVSPRLRWRSWSTLSTVRRTTSPACRCSA